MLLDSGNGKYVLSVDLGTTSMRCYVYNRQSEIIAKSSEPMQLIYPKQGWCEIDPNFLWKAFIEMTKRTINDFDISFSDIKCIGISTLRNTFVTWDKDTGRPLHNFITWKDLRATKVCEEFNGCYRKKAMNMSRNLWRLLGKKNRSGGPESLQYLPGMALMKLVWLLRNNQNLRDRMESGSLLYGTVETWLIWKLTNGKVHATEPSNACVTGLYDPFEQSWNELALNYFKISKNIFPKITDSNGDFGAIDPEHFGVSILITGVIGDQQSAMFGECCFDAGDVKCTLGTGSFLSVNTGTSIQTSEKGIYPVIGWKLTGESPVYLTESDSSDTGTTIVWAQQMDFFHRPEDTIVLASSVSDSGGVYFVPAFSGIQAPINDTSAASSLIGISPSTTKAHIVRAVLEAVAFRVIQMYTTMTSKPEIGVNCIKVNGGIANNDFILQLIADFTQVPVERSTHREMSSLGAAYLAGLSSGYWNTTDDIKCQRSIDQVFKPRNNLNEYTHTFNEWTRAVERCLNWHKTH